VDPEGVRCESSAAENRLGGSPSDNKVQGIASKPIGPP